MKKPARAKIKAALLRFAAERKDATFCPSEVARELAPKDWRPLMPEVRAVAQSLVDAGSLNCTQRGVSVQPLAARGPIRLSALAR